MLDLAQLIVFSKIVEIPSLFILEVLCYQWLFATVFCPLQVFMCILVYEYLCKCALVCERNKRERVCVHVHVFISLRMEAVSCVQLLIILVRYVCVCV